MSHAAVSRRSFLQKVGLGAGAVLLSPIARTLLSEARGEVPKRKRALFFLVGNGIHYDWNFTPPELRQGSQLSYPVLDGMTAFTWPAMLKSLERYRSRMVLIDGLANRPRTGASGHSGGYAALSCFPAANGLSNEEGPPGSITIDQHIAKGIGQGTRHRSVLFGASSSPATQLAKVFASGRLQPEPHVQSPQLLFDELFGALATDAAGVRRGAYRQRVLLDGMREDVKRLQGAMAATERRKLDVYLGAVEELEKRLQITLGMGACPVPGTLGTAPSTTVEDRLEAMNEMATLALACGITNVVGVSAGCGMSHNFFPIYRRIHVGTRFESEGGVSGKLHDGQDVQSAAMNLIHDFHGSLIARTLDALSKIKEGDQTVADSLVALYLSENGEQHHANKTRWPVVVIGNAGGALKTGGRFLRYPARGSAGARALADLFSTIATGCGVPTERFGDGGNEPVKGPLAELLA